jgi:hypothetical protein
VVAFQVLVRGALLGLLELSSPHLFDIVGVDIFFLTLTEIRILILRRFRFRSNEIFNASLSALSRANISIGLIHPKLLLVCI